MPATVCAFLDASVLYPVSLRNLLMRLMIKDLYQARWSADVHEEWIRSVVRDKPALISRLHEVRDAMDLHATDALVAGYEPLIDGLQLPDPNDRHVLAASIVGAEPHSSSGNCQEVAGFNAIPDAMAHVLGSRSGLEVGFAAILQATKVGHTKANGWHRPVTPAEFTGKVVAGAEYILIDDHVGFGGTLANLRGFIEHGGGSVIAMTTLTETTAARRIAVGIETLNLLYSKHGKEFSDFWNREFGCGIDCFTNIEAESLFRVESIAAIKARMAQAAELARGRGLSPVSVDGGS